MKKYLFPIMAGLLTISACGNRQTREGPAMLIISWEGTKTETPADSIQVDSIAQEEETTYFSAIHRYLVDSISSQYAEADIRVPLPTVVAVDESNGEDIKVWGEFWVMKPLPRPSPVERGEPKASPTGGGLEGAQADSKTADSLR